MINFNDILKKNCAFFGFKNVLTYETEFLDLFAFQTL